MCDSAYRFTFVFAISPGSTHDSSAYAMSSLFTTLSSGALPRGYWVAGDEAYVCGEGLITPHSCRQLNEAQDCFNYWQSSARIHIEQEFGILVGRCGILWRPLRTSVAKSTLIIVTLAKIHNFIIDSGGMLTVPRASDFDCASHREPAEMAVLLQYQLDTDEDLHKRRRDTETSILREILTDDIAHNALRRHRVSV
jgi:DDE superfamily endonuclease